MIRTEPRQQPHLQLLPKTVAMTTAIFVSANVISPLCIDLTAEETYTYCVIDSYFQPLYDEIQIVHEDFIIDGEVVLSDEVDDGVMGLRTKGGEMYSCLGDAEKPVVVRP